VPETGVVTDSSGGGGSEVPDVKLRLRGTDLSDEDDERLLLRRLALV
jgi:hypothetical protein